MGYLDTIGSCNCHHGEDADITRGYLGWYKNLNEVLKRYPTPRIGWSFNNVETRSVWIYDGRRWCNTTQGNPFTMITDVNNAGAMRNGYAQTFYYIPTKADVNGGTITFRFDVEGKERFCDVDVWSISDIVFVEWTGSTINTSVHQLDDSVVKHVEQSLTDAQKLQARENIGAIGSEQVTNETNGLQYDVLQKGGRHIYPLTAAYNVIHMNTTVYEAIEKLKEKDKNLDETVVKHIAQSLTDAQKLQAQINIGAVSKAEEEDHMLWQGRIYYPETTTEYVRVPGENKNLATLLTELSSILNGVVKDVETFLSDADVSESAKDTLRELQEYINQDVAAAAEMLASINKLKTEKVDVAGGNVTNTVVELGGDLTPLGEALESAAAALGDIAIAQGDAAARIDHLEKENVKNKENIRTLAEQKAGKEGTYPNLTSGFSDNLVGRGEATSEVFTFRQSGGNTSINDGTARIKSIKGNSVVFNQQLQNTLDITGKEGWRARLGEHNCIIGGNSITLLINTDTSSTSLIGQYANFIKGHVYMHLVQYNVGQITNVEGKTAYTEVRQSNLDGGTHVYKHTKYINSNESGNLNGIFVCSDDAVQAFSLFIANCKKDIGESITFTNIQLIDLTTMFGAGNEPQTVEEFNALYPNDYYEYNAGEIINSNYTAIESVGFNAFDGEKAEVIGGKVYELLGNYTSIGFTSVIGGELTTIEIPEDKHYTPNQNGYIYAVGSDVCIHLCHTGYKDGQYEPYRKDVINLPNIELKKAGNVYDEVRYNPNSEKWEYVQRVGSVDMGELNWWYADGIFTASYSGIKRTSKYPYGNYVNAINSAGYENSLDRVIGDNDKVIGVNYSVHAFESIKIVDTSYTDAASFKEAMQGKILQYELAEPIITELEGDYSTDYIVSDFGTEKAITDKLCAPFSADIIYQFNAVDRIRENSAKIEENTQAIAFKQDELTLTVKDNGNIVIGNIQGQTKEFMPATPSGDPNHHVYELYGAIYNDTDNIISRTDSFGDVIDHLPNCWYLNGLGDLTNENMQASLNYTNTYMWRATTGKLFATLVDELKEKFKTNMPTPSTNPYNSTNTMINADSLCGGRGIKKLRLSYVNTETYFTFIKDSLYMFTGNNVIETIYDYLNVTYCTQFTNSFSSATKLRNIRLIGLKADISFKDSKNLTNASILYMIQKASSTVTFSITLEATAYERAISDTDIQAALTEKTNITLQSA